MGRVASLLHRVGAALATAVLLAGCASAPAGITETDAGGCAGARLEPDGSRERAIHGAVLCLLNAERERHGLQPLVEDPALERAARAHSHDMGRRDFFEHDTPEGVEPWMRITRAGYRADLVGENLAWGEGDKGTPTRALELWMKSPGHRANLLEPRYSQIGIGLAFESPDPRPSGLPSAIYTTTFGSAAVITH
jgi:uncharacterized protein YkwD